MYIANPIYDAAFKYLMEDNKVAKKFISTIIGENVVELELTAQEVQVETEKGLTVCHLDFVAKIAIDGGFKTVIIELQKAKLASDIMRFRRYVGQHYQRLDNQYKDSKDRPKVRQIYCIFLLNHNIGFPNVPMLEVNLNVTDSATGKLLISAKNEFIESLHHRSWIVQIPQLKAHRRNDIENLLGIFDQSHVLASNKHTMDVEEEDFPEQYRDIVRRLLRAYATPEVRRSMEAEDDYLELLREEERKAAAAIARADAADARADVTAAERDKAVAALASKEREAAKATAALATALAELETLKQQKSK
jgi:hypothetical protein